MTPGTVNKAFDRRHATNYFIKEGYRHNETSLTQDSVSGKAYWNPTRLKRSQCFQYPVYRFAGELIARGGIWRVIDVGCGVATKLELLHRTFPHVEFIGIDQPATIAHCKELHNFGRWVADDLERAEGENIDVTGDLVICADVIEHVGDPDLLLGYLKRRVRKDGSLLISTPERDSLRGPSCDYSPNKYHVREWNKTEFESYVRAAGFSILEHRMQLPVRLEFSRLFFSHVVKRALTGRPIRWNQVWLLGVA